jgi:hypothetical protein
VPLPASAPSGAYVFFSKANSFVISEFGNTTEVSLLGETSLLQTRKRALHILSVRVNAVNANMVHDGTGVAGDWDIWQSPIPTV